MKQRLFENVGGNRFVLSEGISDKAELIRGGIKKVFNNNTKVTYTFIESVGLGYINDVAEAKKTALQEARAVAKQCGFKDDVSKAMFVKEENDEHDRIDSDSKWTKVPSLPKHDETDMSNPEENREVQIGNQILQIIKELDQRGEVGPGDLGEIAELARELIKMHGK